MQKSVYEFISEQMHDPILERRICRWTGEEFPIYQWDKELLERISPILGDKKFPLPYPTLSPLARMRRRMMFRNERGLYTCTSAISWKKIVSVYHPDMVKNVISQWEMYSDAYRPMNWGQVNDDNQDFFDQYKKVWQNIPRPGVININNTNWEYNTFSSDNKNIYLCADAMRSEDTLYSTTIKYIKNWLDLLNVWNCDYVYECVSSHQLTKCVHVRYSENCYDCWFLATCKNCTDCFLCNNISDRKNYILNKPASEQEITNIKAMMKTASWLQRLKDQFQILWDTQPRPASMVINCENSLGSVLSNSQNAFRCFDSHDIQNCRYCHVGEFNADAMDCTIFNPKASQVYEQVCGWFLQKSVCDMTCWQSSDIFFSEFVMSCDHMFGCINMMNSSYCIFDRQYTKDEREKSVWNIIWKMQDTGERGEFFPPQFSPFSYNDTVAMDYFPVHKVKYPDGKEEIIDIHGSGTIHVLEDKFIAKAELDLWWKERIPTTWRTKNYEINIPQNAKVIPANQLPESIDEVTDDICSFVILCEQTGRPYQITPIELKIYRALKISLPRLHHSIRHTQRIRRRPAKEFCLRTCSATGEKMLSLYPANASYRVYSQKAFEKLLYG